MWQTDTVYLQTYTEVNTYGSIARTYTRGTAVTCDVQEIDKEYVYKNYGLTDENEFVQVFDLVGASWELGAQVEYNELQWIVRKVTDNLDKMGTSNHTHVILSRVVGDYEAPVTVWILADGIWNDNGTWDDTDTWNDN